MAEACSILYGPPRSSFSSLIEFPVEYLENLPARTARSPGNGLNVIEFRAFFGSTVE
jgi:hypothetical protein